MAEQDEESGCVEALAEPARYVVLGGSSFAQRCAEGILAGGGRLVALIGIPAAQRPQNSADLSGFAAEHGIAYHEIADLNTPDAHDILRAAEADYLFSAWPWMLAPATLALPRRFVIGTHPTLLPFNRGRHPLHWLIALGHERTALSFFRMEAGVDSGDVLLQMPFDVGSDDRIGDLVVRMEDSAGEGARVLCEMLRDAPAAPGTPQDHTQANIWRKRTPHDIILDFRLSVDMIVRTVRSFAPPYPCAKLVFQQHVIDVTAAAAVPESDYPPGWVSRREHGRIVGVDGDRIRLKADGGIVELACRPPLPEPLRKAVCLHPPTRYFGEHGEALKAKLGL